MAILPPLLPVYGVHADAGGVTVRTPPQNGCTPSREMMTVAVARNGDVATLLVARKHPEQPVECRAAGPAADLRWSYQELGLMPSQPIRLANPIASEP